MVDKSKIPAATAFPFFIHLFPPSFPSPKRECTDVVTSGYEHNIQSTGEFRTFGVPPGKLCCRHGLVTSHELFNTSGPKVGCHQDPKRPPTFVAAVRTVALPPLCCRQPTLVGVVVSGNNSLLCRVGLSLTRSVLGSLAHPQRLLKMGWKFCLLRPLLQRKTVAFFQFDGSNGDSLIEIGSTFTKNQKFSIEELKERRKRDHKLDAFLSDQERRPECRRLQLQSILPAEHQV